MISYVYCQPETLRPMKLKIIWCHSEERLLCSGALLWWAQGTTAPEVMKSGCILYRLLKMRMLKMRCVMWLSESVITTQLPNHWIFYGEALNSSLPVKHPSFRKWFIFYKMITLFLFMTQCLTPWSLNLVITIFSGCYDFWSCTQVILFCSSGGWHVQYRYPFFSGVSVRPSVLLLIQTPLA